jgi:hypothetical protein
VAEGGFRSSIVAPSTTNVARSLHLAEVRLGAPCRVIRSSGDREADLFDERDLSEDPVLGEEHPIAVQRALGDVCIRSGDRQPRPAKLSPKPPDPKPVREVGRTELEVGEEILEPCLLSRA